MRYITSIPLLVLVGAIVTPVWILSKLGSKWATDFLEDGIEPMESYGKLK